MSAFRTSIALLLLCVCQSLAADVYVSPSSGDDRIGCGTYTRPCLTLVYTLTTRVSAGDWLVLMPGQFANEQLGTRADPFTPRGFLGIRSFTTNTPTLSRMNFVWSAPALFKDIQFANSLLSFSSDSISMSGVRFSQCEPVTDYMIECGFDRCVVDGCEFRSNVGYPYQRLISATYVRDVLSITRSVFADNALSRPSFTDFNALIYIGSTSTRSFTFAQNQFLRNSGVFQITSYSDTVIRNCVFTSNRLGSYVTVGGRTSFAVEHCAFNNNTAARGAALAFTAFEYAEVTVYNCSFFGDRATVNATQPYYQLAAAIDFQGFSDSLTIRCSFFEFESSVRWAGAVHVAGYGGDHSPQPPQVTITDSYFARNTAPTCRDVALHSSTLTCNGMNKTQTFDATNRRPFDQTPLCADTCSISNTRAQAIALMKDRCKPDTLPLAVWIIILSVFGGICALCIGAAVYRRRRNQMMSGTIQSQGQPLLGVGTA